VNKQQKWISKKKKGGAKKPKKKALPQAKAVVLKKPVGPAAAVNTVEKKELTLPDAPSLTPPATDIVS
jgi:hypothetical protein